MFDKLFFRFQDHYKAKYKKKANSIAAVYISVLQISLVLFLGVLLSKFLNQMHVSSMSTTNAWILFVLIAIAIYFKNWMQYSGRTLTVKKAKYKGGVNSIKQPIFVLWLVPIACLILVLILLKAL